MNIEKVQADPAVSTTPVPVLVPPRTSCRGGGAANQTAGGGEAAATSIQESSTKPHSSRNRSSSAHAMPIPQEQLQVLQECFRRNNYVSPEQCHTLSQQLGLPCKKIAKWFDNTRAKNKRNSSLAGSNPAARGPPQETDKLTVCTCSVDTCQCGLQCPGHKSDGVCLSSSQLPMNDLAMLPMEVCDHCIEDGDEGHPGVLPPPCGTTVVKDERTECACSGQAESVGNDQAARGLPQVTEPASAVVKDEHEECACSMHICH